MKSWLQKSKGKSFCFASIPKKKFSEALKRLENLRITIRKQHGWYGLPLPQQKFTPIRNPQTARDCEYLNSNRDR
jgi:hypothetical protein